MRSDCLKYVVYRVLHERAEFIFSTIGRIRICKGIFLVTNEIVAGCLYN